MGNIGVITSVTIRQILNNCFVLSSILMCEIFIPLLSNEHRIIDWKGIRFSFGFLAK